MLCLDGRSHDQNVYRSGGHDRNTWYRGRGRYNNNSRHQQGGNRSWHSDNRSGNRSGNQNRRPPPEPPLVEMEPSKMMTSKEKEWIFKISIMSLLSGDFYASDYYFIVGVKIFVEWFSSVNKSKQCYLVFIWCLLLLSRIIWTRSYSKKQAREGKLKNKRKKKKRLKIWYHMHRNTNKLRKAISQVCTWNKIFLIISIFLMLLFVLFYWFKSDFS